MRSLFRLEERVLEVGGLGVRALDPASGKVSHAWRFDQILAAVDERSSRRGAWPAQQAERAELSLLVNWPLCCGFGARKLSFALQEHDLRAVLGRIQAGIAAAAEEAAAPSDGVRPREVEQVPSLANEVGVPARGVTTPPPELGRQAAAAVSLPPREAAIAASPSDLSRLSAKEGEPDPSQPSSGSARPRTERQAPDTAQASRAQPQKQPPAAAAADTDAGRGMRRQRVSASCGHLDMLHGAGSASEPTLSLSQQQMLQRMRSSMATLQKVRST